MDTIVRCQSHCVAPQGGRLRWGGLNGAGFPGGNGPFVRLQPVNKRLTGPEKDVYASYILGNTVTDGTCSCRDEAVQVTWNRPGDSTTGTTVTLTTVINNAELRYSGEVT